MILVWCFEDPHSPLLQFRSGRCWIIWTFFAVIPWWIGLQPQYTTCIRWYSLAAAHEHCTMIILKLRWLWVPRYINQSVHPILGCLCPNVKPHPALLTCYSLMCRAYRFHLPPLPHLPLRPYRRWKNVSVVARGERLVTIHALLSFRKALWCSG